MRIIAKLVGIVAWTLPCALIQASLNILPGRAKERFAQLYWRGMRGLLGLKITLIGAVAQERPMLFVVNHSSYLDIVALGSVLPGCFVAKAEIERWPVFNHIARLGRTVFVSRKSSGISRERNQMLQKLKAGDNLILFPEGTTSDGCRVMRFQSSFLALAEGEAAPWVQPVTLVYDRIDGLPARRRDRPLLSWYGDMDLVSHLPGLLGLGSIHATIVLDAPVRPGTYGARKQLSATLEARLGANAASLRQGRSPLPMPTRAVQA